MPMQKNRCAHCNAPLAEGTTFCEYCDLSRKGALRSASAKATGRLSKRGLVKLGLGVVSLTCCLPTGIFVTLSETVYAVAMDAPKFSGRPLAVGERPNEPLAAMDLFMDMRDAADRPLSQRKQEWQAKYEGRWVSWTGSVESIHIYNSLASELVLQPVQGQKFKVEVNFDPIYNDRLKALHEGQDVRVSGKLWGYSFMNDTVRLSDGALAQQDAQGQAQQHSQ